MTAPHVWIQLSFILAKHYIILINFSPHSIPLRFCFACFSIRLLSFSSNFTLTRVGPNILFVYMWIASAESRSVRGASHQPIFMGDCLFVTHICPVCPGNGSVFVYLVLFKVSADAMWT